MGKRIFFALALGALLIGTVALPATGYEDCIISQSSRFELSQRIARNDDGVIANTRGLAIDFTTGSVYLHPNALAFPGNPLSPSSFPSWVRHALRIQTSSSTTSSGSTYIEYGWEYWWQLDRLPNGDHWQRRAYYVYNNSGADPNPHYIGTQNSGQYRFYLYNIPSGTYPNKWVLQTKNLSTGFVATHKVFDPAYDAGNAFSLVAAADSCNEMTMHTGNSWRYSGTNIQWLKVGTHNYAGWWYGQDGNISAAQTHWVVGGWNDDFAEWFSSCYKNGGDGCTKCDPARPDQCGDIRY